MTQSPQSLAERLLIAAKGSDWRGVFDLSETVFNDAEDPDDVFLSAWTELSGDAADTFLEVARDAAGEYLVDDSYEEDGVAHKVEVGLSLFAVPFMMKPGFLATKKDFELLGECISQATDGQPVMIVPRIVSAEDFLAATPEAVRFAIQTIDYNISFEKEYDPLDQIVLTEAAAGPRLLAIVVGARLQRFEGGVEVIPSNWTHSWNDEAYERLRGLLAERCPQFDGAEWPMSFGRSVPTVKSRLRIEQIILGVAQAAEKYNVLPEILVYEEDGRSFVSLSVDGETVSDVVVDRNGTALQDGEIAVILRQVTPSIKVAGSAKDYARRMVGGAVLH
jgi:hypothetical protein